MTENRGWVVIGVVALMSLGCRRDAPPPEPAATPPTAAAAPSAPPAAAGAPPRKFKPADTKVEATDAEVARDREQIKAGAEKGRAASRVKTFEQFEAAVYKEPFEGGKYIVSGDTAISDRKQLEEFFTERIKPQTGNPEAGVGGKLIINTAGGVDTAWNAQQKHQLTYCVSTAFGSRQQGVLTAMEAATGAWEAVADIAFSHVPSADASCSPTNTAVLFDVRPVDVNEEYIARAFFPNEPRASRNVLIDESAFNLDPGGKLTLVGVLRHELGHTLGWRHEHTRPESGTCFEDQDWRPLTKYDAFSVMHYPQCHGAGDWTLDLTAQDKSGAACVYGPAAGFQIDPNICHHTATPPPASGATKVEQFSGQTIALNAEKQFGPFKAKPGTQIVASMTGSGDPDLYVRLGTLKPQRTGGKFSCRPYLTGATEQCELIAGSPNRDSFQIMVHGYTAGSYDLTVTYVPN